MRLSAFAALLLAAPVVAQPVAEPTDSTAIAFIKAEATERGQVMDHATWMTDVHGARLTGSEALDRAQEWAVDRFRSWGVSAELEPWGTFGRGWKSDRMAMSARVSGPDVASQSFPLTAAPKAWSPSTGRASGELVVIDIDDDTLDPATLDVRGKVVLMGSLSDVARGLEPLAQRRDEHELLELANAGLAMTRGAQRRYSPEVLARYRARAARTQAVLTGEPLAILTPSGTGGSGAVRAMQAAVPEGQATGAGGRAAPWTAGVETVAQFAVLDEHANRLIRLAEAGQSVTIDLDYAATFTDEEVVEDNVIAEIPGTDLADEIVIVGGHFDSWHSGSGATDNAAGSAVTMEAARILKAFYDARGEGPRRTIRFALWTGEEQGLWGSRGYVSEHFAPTPGYGEPPTDVLPGHANVSAYYNMDNGSGRFRGVYMQSNEAVRPIFRAWLDAFDDSTAQTLTISNTGGTDHLSFDNVGIPGFQFLQDPLAYFAKTWHTHMDVYDHLDPDDMEQAAAMMATFAHHTAERAEKLPRKAMPDLAGN
ncbi:M20/M25/M40 family metallo-hydrolase [Rubricoccus marinus]|uniref:Carboxypeptidase Q n=1 Tax=Rubricoccus marinus TaxID=716817 RepID=A0A259TYR7_9BACT|nr:M20/M25/M40 family metallo-hydrolase [Rubricoccus marinus]OZC02913.1 hypothetical protein BSZ36_07965 [Rubricoccus marinus]